MNERITAEEVRVGDFLPHLDNGYVVEVDEHHNLVGAYNVLFAPEHTLITFHDANGEENFLLLLPEHPITVTRENEED